MFVKTLLVTRTSLVLIPILVQSYYSFCGGVTCSLSLKPSLLFQFNVQASVPIIKWLVAEHLILLKTSSMSNIAECLRPQWLMGMSLISSVGWNRKKPAITGKCGQKGIRGVEEL